MIFAAEHGKGNTEEIMAEDYPGLIKKEPKLAVKGNTVVGSFNEYLLSAYCMPEAFQRQRAPIWINKRNTH